MRTHKPIFDGAYSVCIWGTIARLRGGRGAIAGRVLAKRVGNHGYCQFTAYTEGGQSRTYLVHDIVAAAFIGRRPKGAQINHKDGDKTNNAAWNLEYVTPKQNARHAAAAGLTPSGERHYKSTLTSEQVREIRRRHKPRQGAKLAREFGVKPSVVNSIIRGINWKNV